MLMQAPGVELPPLHPFPWRAAAVEVAAVATFEAVAAGAVSGDGAGTGWAPTLVPALADLACSAGCIAKRLHDRACPERKIGQM